MAQLRPKDPERAKNLEKVIADGVEAGEMIEKARKAVHEMKSKEYLDQGGKYREAGDYVKAIEADKKSISYKPSSLAYNELGFCYLELKQTANAVLAFQEGIRLEPTDPVLHYNLAHAYMELSEWEKAKASAKESLRLKADDVVLINMLGVAHFRLTEYSEALAQFQKATRLAPKDGQYHHNLGKTYFKMGRTAEAQRVYSKLLTLDKAQAQKLYEVMHPPATKKHN
ncbi:MAG: tetratricopeptide repeat protein [Pyrinomonadaceae bacterium]